nr:PREDICTED: RNA-directed DNA polymerase from mobile element jockey-like [Megachile rotundata]
MVVSESGETMGSDHQVLSLRIGEVPDRVPEAKGTRKFKMEKLDQAKFLKWLLEKEVWVTDVARSGIGVEQKCIQITSMLQEGIVECMVDGRKGKKNRLEKKGIQREIMYKRGKRNVWWDGECERLKGERKKAVNNMLKKPCLENWNRMLEARKEMDRGKCRYTLEKSQSNNEGNEKKNESVLSKEEKIRLEREEAEKIVGLCGVSGNEEVMGTIEDSLRVEREVDWANRDRNGDRYDSEFDIDELERVLRLLKNKSAPGEDGIDFSVIKKLTKGWKEGLIKLYNEVWVKGEVPAMWKKTRVRLIPKPKKKALRPISLLNCLGKVMKRMVNERVRLWAESEEKLDRNQNGFRKRRATIDNINILMCNIREGLDKGKETVAAFIDVKAAYDSKGCVCMLISGYKRGEIVIMQSEAEGRVFTLKRGLPQGSVLSPLLYNLYTTGIVEGIRELGAKILQYADDIVVYVIYENRKEGLKKLEEAVRRLCSNLGKRGLKIAEEKTQVVTFIGNKRGVSCRKEDIMINGVSVKECECAKFLGIILDRKMLFREHTEKGACPSVMLKIFKALMRSVIKYGGNLYLTYKKNRDRIQKLHNAGIRAALGYRISTPINVMEVEAGIMRLDMRIEMLTERYVVKKYYRMDKEVCKAIEGMVRYRDIGESSGDNEILALAWRNTIEIRDKVEKRYVYERSELCNVKVENWVEVEKGVALQ